MFERMRAFGGTLLVLALAAGLAACGDDPTGLEGSGTATVQLASLGSSSQSMAASVVEADPRLGAVALEDVESIILTIERVEAHRAGTEEDSADGGDEASDGWVGIDVETQTLDLIQDLSDDQTVTVAEGELPAGDYDQVRFFLSEAEITFATEMAVSGPGEDIPAGEPVSLRIPSSEQSGLKVPDAGFTVGEAATEVTITFDEGTSIQNITITGTGQVIMAPVLAAGDEESDEG